MGIYTVAMPRIASAEIVDILIDDQTPFHWRKVIGGSGYEVVMLLNDDWREVTPCNDKIKVLGTYGTEAAAEAAHARFVALWTYSRLVELGR